MIASEFAFLALGLGLGAVIGAALSIVIRARPSAPREIRMTVVPDAIPRRPAATLSGPEVQSLAVGVRGGPAAPEVLGAQAARAGKVAVAAAATMISGSGLERATTMLAAASAAPAVTPATLAAIPGPGPGTDPYQGIRIGRSSRRLLVAVPIEPAADRLLASLAASPLGEGLIEPRATSTPDPASGSRQESARVQGGAPGAVRVPAVAVVAGAVEGVVAARAASPAVTLMARPVMALAARPVVALVTRPVVALVAMPRAVQHGPTTTSAVQSATAPVERTIGPAGDDEPARRPPGPANSLGEVPVGPGPGPQARVDATAASDLTASAPTASAPTASSPTASAPTGTPSDAAGTPNDPAGHSTEQDATAVDACAQERRIAVDRCAMADRLHEEATAAVGHLQDAQRTYDDHQNRAQQAAEAAGPRAIRAAKEAAWHAFRGSNSRAHTAETGEAAARSWLQEVDRINRDARDQAALAERERAAANGLVGPMERLALAADVARINAESAAAACHLAHEALAACEERVEELATGHPPLGPTDEHDSVGGAGRLVGGPEFEPRDVPLDEDAARRVYGGREPAIIRLLHGDRETAGVIAEALSGGDPTKAKHWQLALGGLTEAIVARAIEAGALVFPPDHPFWGPFTQAQARDVATALASLGYRFDGLGGFVDERLPSQRDLSLAVGYAGLDPMRIRHWPTEAEMTNLYAEVTVAADEFIAGAAGDLTLGEMVALLPGRAESLTDLWNAWGRVRPLLLRA